MSCAVVSCFRLLPGDVMGCIAEFYSASPWELIALAAVSTQFASGVAMAESLWNTQPTSAVSPCRNARSTAGVMLSKYEWLVSGDDPLSQLRLYIYRRRLELCPGTALQMRCTTPKADCGRLMKLPMLQHLILRNFLKIDAAVMDCMRNLSHLRVIELVDCKELADEEIGMLSRIKSLESIRLSVCQHLGDASVALLATLPLLRDLDVSFCLRLTDKAIRSLASPSHPTSTSLQHISVAYCVRLTDAAAALFSTMQLRSIDMSHCDSVTDYGIELLAKSKTVERINVSGCSRLTDKSLKALALTPGSETHTLILNSLDRLTDIAVVRLAAGKRDTLQWLELQACHSLSSMVVEQLAVFRSLRKLNLSSSKWITDDALTHLLSMTPPNSLAPVLEELCLVGCSNLTEKCGEALRHCANLYALDVSLCEQLGDGFVGVLSEGLPQLQYLNMSRNPVTDGGLAALVEPALPLLKHLRVQRCPQVTEEGLRRLRASRPHLDARL